MKLIIKFMLQLFAAFATIASISRVLSATTLSAVCVWLFATFIFAVITLACGRKASDSECKSDNK